MREKILELLRQRPFQAFRLHLSNGIVHLIRHPDQMLVAQSYAVIGIPADDTPGPEVSDTAIVSLIHIVQATPVNLANPPATTN